MKMLGFSAFAAFGVMCATPVCGQTLEEAAVVLYDPGNVNEWEASGSSLKKERLKGRDGPGRLDNFTLSVRNCVVTVTRHETYAEKPEYNYAVRRTIDLNKIIELISVEREIWNEKNKTYIVKVSYSAAKGAVCSKIDSNGANSRIPDVADDCTSGESIKIGSDAITTTPDATVDRIKKAFSFIRANHCKGRAF